MNFTLYEVQHVEQAFACSRDTRMLYVVNVFYVTCSESCFMYFIIVISVVHMHLGYFVNQAIGIVVTDPPFREFVKIFG